MVLVGLVGVNAMAEDTITISGTILPSAVVGFSDVSGETLNENDRFLDAIIDLQTAEPDASFTVPSKNFYVKSNNPNGVQVSITPHTGENANGYLTRTTGAETLSAQYYIGGFSTYSMSASPTIALTTEATDGTTEEKSFAIVPTIPETHTAGIYDTVLDVTIICP